MLGACFLPVVSSLALGEREAAAELVQRLQGTRRAVAEALLGQASLVDAYLAEKGQKWDAAVVAMLRDDEAAFEAVQPSAEAYVLGRICAGGVRALKIQDEPGQLEKWTGRLRSEVLELSDKPRAAHILSRLGRMSCSVGLEVPGQKLLDEALELCLLLPKERGSFKLVHSLERVASNALRAGAVSTALRCLQKCTIPHTRHRIARRLAVHYVECGDIGGALHLLTFIKDDQRPELEEALTACVRALLPGWTSRVNAPGALGLQILDGVRA